MKSEVSANKILRRSAAILILHQGCLLSPSHAHYDKPIIILPMAQGTGLHKAVPANTSMFTPLDTTCARLSEQTAGWQHAHVEAQNNSIACLTPCLPPLDPPKLLRCSYLHARHALAPILNQGGV